MGGFWRSASGCTAACRRELEELRREVLELRRQAHYYRRMHGKAVEREQRLKEKLQAARAKLKELRQRLRERWARRRGQQPGAAGHGRRGHAHLPVQVEAHDVEPERRRCPACGDEYGAHGSEDSEQLEIEVRAYRRVIKRRRYRRSCQCAAAPRLITAPAPARLIPKGILGISVWVTVLIDKYLLYRPTYRLLADPAQAPELERLGDQIAELSARIDAATYELLCQLREFDRRHGWEGWRSCAHWLNWRTGLDLGAAR